MIACASDLSRHDRMLDMTGGDTAALTEIRTALDSIAAQDTPDLGSALVLASHRDHLIKRNDNTPAELPAVWATLGQVLRAEGLAMSITDTARRAEALARVATALADSGHHERAIVIAGQAADGARTLGSSWSGSHILAQAGVALARIGAYEQAEAIATAVMSARAKAEALADISATMARAGEAGQAERVALAIDDPEEQARALARISAVLAGSGARDQAIATMRKAQAAIRVVDDASKREEVLARVAAIAEDAGLHEQAQAAAETIIGGTAQRAKSLSHASMVLAKAGASRQAVEVARSALREARSQPERDAALLMNLAARWEESGDHKRAESDYRRAEAAVSSKWGIDPVSAGRTLADIAAALTAAGDHEEAVATAQEVLSLVPSAMRARSALESGGTRPDRQW